MPSTSSDANASASAWPQSMPPSSSAVRAALELAGELRMDREALLHRHELAVERAQPFGIDGGDDVRRAGRRRAGLFLCAARRVPRGGGRALRAAPPCVSASIRVRLLGGHLPGGHRAARRTACRTRWLVGDRLGHERLRVRRLVLLVVAEAAVADEVDDDVVPEALAERHREPRGRDGGLGIVGVHVDDRRVEALREVARVARRAALRGVGREADLVVRDQVQRAAGRVAGQSPRS